MQPFNKAPLPFLGQKRNFLTAFKELLRDEFSDFKDATFIDAFGGSGLLSHTIKTIYPNARVVFNDFDGYMDRINALPHTQEILHYIAPYLKASKGNRISEQNTAKIKEIFTAYKDKVPYFDAITLSSSVLFSGNYAHSADELLKRNVYYIKNRGQVPYYDAFGYLAGVEIVKKDGIKLMREYLNDKNVVLVLDPPYLQTLSAGYKAPFSLTDYMHFVSYLREPFIVFSSTRSELLEFLKHMAEQGINKVDYELKTRKFNKTSKDVKISTDGTLELMLFNNGRKDFKNAG